VSGRFVVVVGKSKFLVLGSKNHRQNMAIEAATTHRKLCKQHGEDGEGGPDHFSIMI
jgi:hypothetical protein